MSVQTIERSPAEQALLGDQYCCLSAMDLEHGPSDYDTALPRPHKTLRAGGQGLLRYPGGKRKLLKSILPRLGSIFADLGPDAEYREPFLGGAAVALGFLKNQTGRPAWLNDGDPALSTLWNSVIHDAESLKMVVSVFPYVLDAAYFYYYRDKLRSIQTPDDLDGFDSNWIALAKLATHQLSYSGLGTCAGGPMGGRHQRDPDAIGSRYNPDGLCAKLDQIKAIFSTNHIRDGKCSCLDFARLFEAGQAGYYIDPPYYQAGPGLYQFSFTHEDHVRLASLLRNETRPWLLSYDDHPVIRDLYEGWSQIEEVGIGYSINGSQRKVELLISSR